MPDSSKALVDALLIRQIEATLIEVDFANLREVTLMGMEEMAMQAEVREHSMALFDKLEEVAQLTHHFKQRFPNGPFNPPADPQ